MKESDILKANSKDRLDFVDKWAEFVKTHSDKEWSIQQNKIINSQLKSPISRLEYLKMKGEL